MADTEVVDSEGGEGLERGALHSVMTALGVAPQRRQATLLERLHNTTRTR